MLWVRGGKVGVRKKQSMSDEACKHAPRKTPFGGCSGCKYESEARKYVVDGVCYHCLHFEPEDSWEEKIKKNKEEIIIQNFVQTMLDV